MPHCRGVTLAALERGLTLGYTAVPERRIIGGVARLAVALGR